MAKICYTWRHGWSCCTGPLYGNPDGVRYVLVFKPSRFARNAADVLYNLQIMQDNGVDLISTKEGIDSSGPVGKFMISVLAAVAEIERNNIKTQTMEGIRQKALEGGWTGPLATGSNTGMAEAAGW